MSIKYLNDAWSMPGINAQEKILLLAIADCSNDEGYAYPGYEKLLKKTGIGSRATLSKCIKVLKGVGILNSESHGYIGNGKKVNTYTISLRCELSINTDAELIEKINDLRKSHSNAKSTGCELRKVQGVYSISTGCVHETSLETPERKPSVLDIVKSQKFTIPTLEQVSEHIKSKNYSIDAETFIAHYNSNGWMVGKNKMKCWKSTLVTWSKSQRQHYKQNNIKQTHQHIDYGEYEPSDAKIDTFKTIEGERVL